MPPWQRQALPLVFCGDALAAVPGIGVDVAFAARAGMPGFTLDWHPTRRTHATNAMRTGVRRQFVTGVEIRRERA